MNKGIRFLVFVLLFPFLVIKEVVNLFWPKLRGHKEADEFELNDTIYSFLNVNQSVRRKVKYYAWVLSMPFIIVFVLVGFIIEVVKAQIKKCLSKEKKDTHKSDDADEQWDFEEDWLGDDSFVFDESVDSAKNEEKQELSFVELLEIELQVDDTTDDSKS